MTTEAAAPKPIDPHTVLNRVRESLALISPPSSLGGIGRVDGFGSNSGSTSGRGSSRGAEILLQEGETLALGLQVLDSTPKKETIKAGIVRLSPSPCALELMLFLVNFLLFVCVAALFS